MSYIGPFCLVVASGVLQNSSDVFTILDPDSGGAATFSVPLSANGALPASHYGARSLLQDTTHNALTTMNTTQFKAYVDQVAAERGRTPVGSVTAFKNNVQISAANANFDTFIGSLGLQRVQAPE
jgi:hypothetical protein